MSAENKVPAIRFKGFGGEWEESSFSDISESFEYGLNAAAKKYDGKHKYIRITDINEATRAFDLSDVTSPNTDLSIADNYKLKLGDILFARTGASVGKTYIYRKRDGVVYFAGFLIRARIKEEVNAEFVFQSTLTKKYNKFIRLTSQRSGQPGVNALEYEAYSIFLPLSKEQIKIGNYFKQLDTLIAQHQQKHDKLLNLKKALLEKMFPKQGAEVPEIRFKGFSGEWDRRKLLSNFEKIIDFRGRTPKKLGLDWSETGYLALSALNVKNGFIDFNTDANFGDQELYDKWMSGNELHKNQVLFTTEAPMGNVAQIPDDRKYILSQRTIAFEVNPKLIEENFLAVTLRSPSVQRKFTSLSSGGTAQGVSQKSLASVDVVVPKDTTEQTKIGNFFKQLDTLLNQHQAQLKKLNNIKQACLEKMFV